MRILANYGHRGNGDSYSVTFETIGDVPQDKAAATVDELFRKAKAAIERQINPEGFSDQGETVIPKPKKNGNGKPAIKDPEAPLSVKQKTFIIRLARQKGEFIENINDLTMQEASKVIEELMVV